MTKTEAEPFREIDSGKEQLERHKEENKRKVEKERGGIEQNSFFYVLLHK